MPVATQVTVNFSLKRDQVTCVASVLFPISKWFSKLPSSFNLSIASSKTSQKWDINTSLITIYCVKLDGWVEKPVVKMSNFALRCLCVQLVLCD